MIPLIIVAGPTGVGKTAAAIEIARALSAEIVSADAMAVYRYMDIGTAKPTKAEREAAPHHLIDVADPDEDYDAARFAAEAARAIGDISAKGRPVVVAGGTGLYLKALLYGLFDEGAKDPAVRENLKQELAELGPEALHARLESLDPATAAKIHVNDSYRTVRALEVISATGRPVSESRASHGFSRPLYRHLFFCINDDREALYERIERRVAAMMEAGLLDEVRGLLARGCGPELKSMRSIGYRHMVEALTGVSSLTDAVTRLCTDTRRLAKRQLTWFKAVPGLVWVSPGDTALMIEMAARHIGLGEKSV
ncbi:MAG: tRNA (adenosine(37)-N6)-dimethylallyltransferase MiaA [Deltaproteobacteria bacterium]|nr:tRNA (adenosine(37)-N6)-dimethylallyltransferase MiaA [Deltaproteobacteria bacterium]